MCQGKKHVVAGALLHGQMRETGYHSDLTIKYIFLLQLFSNLDPEGYAGGYPKSVRYKVTHCIAEVPIL